MATQELETTTWKTRKTFRLDLGRVPCLACSIVSSGSSSSFSLSSSAKDSHILTGAHRFRITSGWARSGVYILISLGIRISPDQIFWGR
ncbi:hypothetical protein D6C78_11003 [Aureobasidium pullulans]|uniref:Uncharacterized protein n=1 Tax=Aureobasidium pullulans TaxID=5580 RepID=A0A4T0B498_AURPU|nr:hypothetical protein D6C78_11003 [Aureobasidium pullulans]